MITNNIDHSLQIFKYLKQEDCVGVFLRPVHVTRMKLENQNESMPVILVPRVWYVFYLMLKFFNLTQGLYKIENL